MTLYLFFLTLVLATAATAGVLIAVWAGQSQHHWFWRAFAIWLCIATMLPVRAYEPALLFSFSLPIIALSVWAAAVIKKRAVIPSDALQQTRFTYRFTLRDSLLAVTILSLFLTIAVEVPRAVNQQPDWIGTRYPGDVLLPAAAVALVGLLAWYAVWGKFRIVAVVSLVVAITCFAWFMSSRCEWLYVWDDDITELGINSLMPSSDRERLRMLVTTFGLWQFATLLFVIALLSAAAAHSPAARHIHRAVLTVMGIGLAGVYFAALQLPTFPPSVTVSPNHFDRIMQIAQRAKEINENSIAAEEVEEDDPAIASELRDLRDELIPLLAVPNAKSVDLSSKTERQSRERTDLDGIGLARNLSRWLVAEARAARIRGDLPTAADFALANIQFAAAFRTNGLLIDELIARAMLNGSYRELYAARQDFDKDTIQQLIAALHRVDRETEPIGRIVQRDLAYCDREYGWQGRFGHPIARLTQGNDPLRWKDYSQYPKSADNYLTIVRLLEIDLAIRAFELARGQLPDNLNALVPEFLPAEPLDPFTGRSFIYQLSASADFTLYGVGSDGKDNGGRFTDLSAHHYGRNDSYDFDLETLVRPRTFP